LFIRIAASFHEQQERCSPTNNQPQPHHSLRDRQACKLKAKKQLEAQINIKSNLTD